MTDGRVDKRIISILFPDSSNNRVIVSTERSIQEHVGLVVYGQGRWHDLQIMIKDQVRMTDNG